MLDLNLAVGFLPLILLAAFGLSLCIAITRRNSVAPDNAFAILMVATTVSSIVFSRSFGSPNHVRIFCISQLLSSSIFFVVAALVSWRSNTESEYAQRFLKQSTFESIRSLTGCIAYFGLMLLIINFLGAKLNEPCSNARCRFLDAAIGSHESGFLFLYLLNIIAAVAPCAFVMGLYSILHNFMSGKRGR